MSSEAIEPGTPETAADATANDAPPGDTAANDAAEVATTAQQTSEDANRRLWEQYEAAGAAVRAAEAALADCEARRRALVDEPADLSALDAQIAAYDRLEDEQVVLERGLATVRRRQEFLGDQVHRLRLLGRGRRVTELRAKVDALYLQEQKIKSEIGERQAVVAALERDLQSVQLRRKPIEVEAVRLEPHPSKKLTISLASANAWLPPTEVLVKGSAWRLFIERVKAAGRTGTIDLVVNEHLGTIVACPQLDSKVGAQPTGEVR